MQSIQRMAELADDWSYIAQYNGWGAAASEISSKLLSMLYERRLFFVIARSLTEPLPELSPKIYLEIRSFEQADLDLIQGFSLPSDIKLCARRLECGHRGFLALVHNRPAGYAWSYTPTQQPLDSVRFEMSPEDVLLLSDYTVPAYRGQGVQKALILARLRMFHNLGYQRAFSCINPQNSPSLAAYRKVGGYEYGVIDVLRLGPWRRTYFRRVDGTNG